MNKLSFFVTLFCVAMAASSVVSCEKAIIDEESSEEVTQGKNSSKTTGENGDKDDKGKVAVVLRVSKNVQEPIKAMPRRAVVDLTTYCTRLNFVVYKDGVKVKGLSQTTDDSNFGEVTMKLDPGDYKLLVLAHKSVGGNPTVSDPENIHFTNALGYSDTFSYYGDLFVGGQDLNHSLLLTRNVSLLRFVINDEFPPEVKYMHFYYTGGSGVLNAVTGYGGNVNSQQEKLVDVIGMTSPATFNLYTFLQQEEGKLQVRVRALASDKSTIILECTFGEIGMKHQKYSEYSGYFFDSDQSFTISAETDWGEPYQELEY